MSTPRRSRPRAIPVVTNGLQPGWSWFAWEKMRQIPSTFFTLNAAAGWQTYVHIDLASNSWADRKRMLIRTLVQVDIIQAIPVPGYSITERIAISQFGTTLLNIQAPFTASTTNFRVVQDIQLIRIGNTIYVAKLGENYQYWSFNSDDGILHALPMAVAVPPFNIGLPITIDLQVTIPIGLTSIVLTPLWCTAFIESPTNLGFAT